MLFDALFAFIVVKFFGIDGLTVLGALAAVTLIRTCHNMNWLMGAIVEETITALEEEEEEN